MFFIIETRLDIVFATFVISWFAKNPSCQHIEVVKTIIKYLKTIRLVKITYGKKKKGGKNLIIKRYSDSYKISNHTTRKSTSGFVFMLNGGPINWYAKRQATVVLSLTKTKYIALMLVVKEAI